MWGMPQNVGFVIENHTTLKSYFIFPTFCVALIFVDEKSDMNKLACVHAPT